MASFEAEKAGDVALGRSFIHPEFRMTEMNIGPSGTVFRSFEATQVNDTIPEVFQISDREYQFVHCAADEATQTVMVEFVESYTDPNTSQRFRTPIVAVCEIRDGKIYRTRHYTDDRLSDLYLPQSDIDRALS